MTTGELIILAAASLVTGMMAGLWSSRDWLAFTLTGSTGSLSVLLGGRERGWQSTLSSVVAGWIAFVLQSERTICRPRGSIPAKAIRMERYPKPIVERVIRPASVALLQVSTAAHSSQYGRLQFCLLLVFRGLIVLGVIALTGRAR
jgi:hypothetical protein